MAYDAGGGYCKCMSGYVFQDSYFGTQCVSGNTVCHEKYGYGSSYVSYSDSCECDYGYVWGEDIFGDAECVSEDQACKDQYGYNARATYGGQCECSYGYVIDGGKCVYGDQVCRNDHGYHSSYNSLSNACECDDEYTFDDNYQCVEKQHNVYFKLLDINPENDKELLIQSDYDSRKYIVRVGVGCFYTSIARYEGKNLVVNLGTDYEVDMFDTVVLQDHGQTCSIMHKERTFDDSFPEPEEEEDYSYYYIPPANTYTPASVTPEPAYLPDPTPIAETVETQTLPIETVDSKTIDYAVTEIEEVSTSMQEIIASTTPEQEQSNEVSSEAKQSFFARIINFFRGLFQ